MKNTFSIEVADRLKEVGEYYFSTKLREIDRMRAEGKDVISLGIGSPDRPPHPSVIERLSQAALNPNVHGYQPYKGAAVLRNAFAKWYDGKYGVKLDPESEILPLIGSKEGLMHICMTYINKGDKVLLPNPGYPTYSSAVTIAGGVCMDYKLTAGNDWMPDFEHIEWQGLEGVKMMIVNYPQMPTGAIPTDDIFQQLVSFARKHNILLVHDNPYSFVRNPKPASILTVPGAMDVTLELNSLSKSHNMAGWRVGMVAGKKERLDEIIRFKSNMDSGMFLPIQEAAAAALELGDDWYKELNDVYYERETVGYALLDAVGCKYREGQAGLFIWAELPEGYEGDCFTFSDHYLYNHGVFFTPGGIFGSEGLRYVRITLCTPAETLQRALDKIKAAK